jgi:hypothetical protein
MSTKHQVRGVLLEEAILALLRAAGYRTVTQVGSDPTLGTCAAGLTVRGRGACHQIDAIADLRVGLPFSNPQRLLVEAKAYADYRPIGLATVRGSVGVLKDVSEYWIAKSATAPAINRYHYQAAIFSTSEFTTGAQQYAYAHDIYLVPLARSAYFSPVIVALDNATNRLPIEGGNVIGVDLTRLRRHIRSILQPEVQATNTNTIDFAWASEFTTAAKRVGQSLIAILGHAFPVFLTPGRDIDLTELPPEQEVRIHFEADSGANGWTIATRAGVTLFTFDLPDELFDLYADEGILSERKAVDLKETLLGEFTALYAPQERVRVFNFRLDHGWVQEVRARIRTRRR